jgi:hypothetical protein
MKIRKMRQVVDGVFEVVIKTEEWSELDRNLMAKFGEPEIDLGGEFDAAISDLVPIFTLATELADVMSESPFKQVFDSDDFTYAMTMAQIWEDEVADRIMDAVSVLRINSDEWSGEEVVNV